MKSISSEFIQLTNLIVKLFQVPPLFMLLQFRISLQREPKMSNTILLMFFLLFIHHSLSQDPKINTCILNQTVSPCRTYAFYRAMAPDFLDLATIGDLFSVSRLMISTPSNLTTETAPLVLDQHLFIPITCSCNSVNTTLSMSYANLTYTIKKGDNFYFVSIHSYQNLTNYQSVQIVNPTLVPTLLQIGQNVVFPITCRCPNATQLQNGTNYIVSYVFQPGDTLASVSLMFGVNITDIIDLNGERITPLDVIFIPVVRLPILKQPNPPLSSKKRNTNQEAVMGLVIGLGFSIFLLVLVCGLWGYRERFLKKRRGLKIDEEREISNMKRTSLKKEVEVNLMADVSDCLDKYRVFGIEELREATDGFDQKWVIQGSVYRGCIDGEVYAIKKMKWNASEELKILQKVNHGNLVKLEGFSMDPEDGDCYLIYEYVEKGSLYTYIHGNKNEKLNWKTRLRIAIDVANGLQYIHEHTRPRVVHKDIKTSNILLDTKMRAKIANFGLAKSGCNAITTHVKGTQGYVAPEYLSSGMVSTKMDVFSFGVVLLELISGREAVDRDGNVLWATVEGISEEKEGLKKWMDQILSRESYLMESVMNVMGVAVACLNKNPSKRPSMVEIVYALCKSEDLVFDISEDGVSPSRVLIAR